MNLHEIAQSVSYRDFHDMVEHNYSMNDLLMHLLEYLRDEDKKVLVDMLVEYIYNDSSYDIKDLMFKATGVYECDS